MPTTRTHHVALVHEGRVRLAADGTLPRFEQDLDADDSPEPTAYASTLVGPGAHLAPVVRLPDPTGAVSRASEQLHVLALRGEPTGGEGWHAIERLPEPWAAPVRSAVQQYADRAPARRPEWYLPGWHDRVEAWIDASLAGTDRHRTGPLVVHRVWSISAVLRVPTDRGDLWFKACCDHFRAEAAILHRLARRLPDLVPVLVAVDDDAGWLLMEPLSGVDDDRAPGAPAVLAPVWAAAQLSSLDWLDELTAAGCPDRTLEPTLAAWHRVVATSPEMELLTAEERTALLASVEEVEARVREFWSCGIPDTLAHGDLHLGNVAHDGATLRLFDWTDACVSHPFLDGIHLATFVGSDIATATAEMARDFATPWRSARPDADVDRALELAGFADLVFQSVTFAAIAEATEDGADDFTGTVAWLSRAILRELGAIPD